MNRGLLVFSGGYKKCSPTEVREGMIENMSDPFDLHQVRHA